MALDNYIMYFQSKSMMKMKQILIIFISMVLTSTQDESIQEEEVLIQHGQSIRIKFNIGKIGLKKGTSIKSCVVK